MEKGIEQNLKSMVNDAKEFPELRQEFEDHMKITKNHAEMTENRIIELDGEVADTKKLMSQFTVLVQGMTMKMMSYKNLKNVSMEIQIIAQKIGDMDTVDLCEDILSDEIDMSRILEKTMPDILEKEMLRSLSH
ncbi:DUF892 family protein [Candidatus Pacearchaeota archaeon]|nr:DUF892 family protein [Candidatus Pacearchaeota archaeon]